MSLTRQIAEFEAEKRRTHDADVLEKMDVTTADLVATGIAERAVGQGDAAPDFPLPDHLGRDVVLSRVLARGPVLLTFYRGGWCPYCNLELRAYQRELDRIRKAGGSLLAVSPMLPDGSLETAQKNALEFPVLSDVGNRVADAYGLVFQVDARIQSTYRDRLGIDLEDLNGDGSFTLPLPATYVIARDGRVAYAYVNADYRLRADPADALDALEGLD